MDVHDREKTTATYSLLHIPLVRMVDCISANAQDSERRGPKEFIKEEEGHCHIDTDREHFDILARRCHLVVDQLLDVLTLVYRSLVTLPWIEFCIKLTSPLM